MNGGVAGGNLEVAVSDTLVGTGREALKGALVKMHYDGYLDDGRKFDSSIDKGRVFEFVVGSKKVIVGMSQGILGMREGGKRTIFIPAPLAYGERAVNGIPPHSNLTFQVELFEALPRE